MSSIDSLFGVRALFVAGVEKVFRVRWNFVGDVTVEDEVDENNRPRTKVTIGAGSSSANRDMFALTGAANSAAPDHAGKIGTVSHGSATTFTVQPNSTVAIPAKSEITLVAIGAGQLTIAPGAGVTIRTAETLKARKQYSWVSLKKDATTENLWYLTGDLELV